MEPAIAQFVRIAEQLRSQGFLPKASAVYKKILKITPDDERAMLRAAEIAGELGHLADARVYLSALGDRRRRRGDAQGVSEVVVRLGALDPADYEARLAGAKARAELHDRAGALAELEALAAEASANDRSDIAAAARREAALLAPEDAAVRDAVVDVHMAAPQTPAASLEIAPDAAEGDPRRLLRLAESHARSGRGEESLAIVKDLLAVDPGRRDAVAALGWAVAEKAPHVAFQIVEEAASAAIAQADWGSAAAALQEFVTRVPAHVPALLRLVGVCVDGGLEATLFTSQAQLADAYLAAGLSTEARFVAEDLVAREPWERANIERFRRALELSGEADPDQVIADRLNGQSPFISLDLTGRDDLSAGSVRESKASAAAGSVPGSVLVPEHAPAETGFADPVGDLEAVWRDEASRQATLDAADEEFSRGLALHEAGRSDSAVPLLASASRAPGLRFAAASLVARIHRDRGDQLEAAEWFERAAQAPAPTSAEGLALLYELADVLEQTGEVARALAICIELQSEAGHYRDVVERIDRLFKAQPRG